MINLPEPRYQTRGIVLPGEPDRVLVVPVAEWLGDWHFLERHGERGIAPVCSPGTVRDRDVAKMPQRAIIDVACVWCLYFLKDDCEDLILAGEPLTEESARISWDRYVETDCEPEARVLQYWLHLVTDPKPEFAT